MKKVSACCTSHMMISQPEFRFGTICGVNSTSCASMRMERRPSQREIISGALRQRNLVTINGSLGHFIVN
jgi:hypothetical protein